MIDMLAGEPIDDRDCEQLLWGETCYPFGDVPRVVRQLRSAIRARRNRVKRCDLCAQKLPYHVHGCPGKEGER